ncbi:MAG TPA: OmpA family protein [Salegentibacter sp.]|uniref:OmpA family protein n=1 Tax=Salegentibacter sp. TaxID=1903072 RepID=UPI002F94AC27
MGERPQSHQNALKPYGLLYELLKNHEVDVKWIINPDKEKDGIDFSCREMDYRSGAFLVPVSYLTAGVRETFETWKLRGVVIQEMQEDLALPVFTSLTIPPRWTLDKENGYIAVPFFKAAGIPSSAFGGARVSNWKTPAELGVCDDIFVLPHADPKFESHKNLYYWNQKYKGAIWAGCHAASILENLSGPGEDSEDVIQLNFLSAGFPGARSAGLVHFREHRHGTPPYKNAFPADPVAQYLGSPDKAHLNGSERIFFPKRINKWRSGAKILVSDPDAPDKGEITNAEAAVSVYGHGFDNPENGLVMYQAGHSIYGETQDHIAALRAFFNWSFYAAEVKRKENLISFKSRDSNERTVGAKIGDDLTDILNLDPIHFDLDEYIIREKVKPQLTEIAEFMLKNPAILLDIRSHTDSRADDAYNQQLSDDRVKATRDFLMERGVEGKRISGRGYGETELLNECKNGVPCNENQHEANRRSEFILSIDCRIYNREVDLRL